MISATEYVLSFQNAFADEIQFTNAKAFYKNIVYFDALAYANEKDKINDIHIFMSLAYAYRNEMKEWEIIKDRPNYISEDARAIQKIKFRTIEMYADDGYLKKDKRTKAALEEISALHDEAITPVFKRPTKKAIENHLISTNSKSKHLQEEKLSFKLSRKAKLLKDSI